MHNLFEKVLFLFVLELFICLEVVCPALTQTHNDRERRGMAAMIWDALLTVHLSSPHDKSRSWTRALRGILSRFDIWLQKNHRTIGRRC